MDNNVEEIVKGLWADPKDITDIYHCKNGGCIGIHWGLKSHGKVFYTEEEFSEDGFREEATRIRGLVENAKRHDRLRRGLAAANANYQEERLFFDPPNVKPIPGNRFYQSA